MIDFFNEFTAFLNDDCHQPKVYRRIWVMTSLRGSNAFFKYLPHARILPQCFQSRLNNLLFRESNTSSLLYPPSKSP